MTLSNVRPGDIVRCDVKGRVFYAIACERIPPPPDRARELRVEPITLGITYMHVTSRQVIAHWRKAGRPRSRA
jgi:hypothetical protein